MRKAQREKAIKTKDTAMLCFLGKNVLKQTDSKNLSIGGQDGKPIEIKINMAGKAVKANI